MRKFALYFFAAFLLTSCDNLKTKDASTTEDETEETTTKKKKKALDEEESEDEELTSKKKKKSSDDEADYTDNTDDEETSDADGWTKAEQNEFMQNCVGEASNNLGQEKAEDYCSCMMGKIQKRYPNANDVTELTETEMTRMAKTCY